MTRVVLMGLGVMGSRIASALLDREGYQIVGAVDLFPQPDLGEFLGREPLGVPVLPTLSSLTATAADICVICTASRAAEVAPHIFTAAAAGWNVVTTAEEMAFPWAADAELAADVDLAAKNHGVSVAGSGINPGFVMDLLPAVLTAACLRISGLSVRRVNDLSAYGPATLAGFGIGLTEAQFERGLATGTISGHVGFAQSIALITAATGLRVDRWSEQTEPIISTARRSGKYFDVAPGQVAGAIQTAQAYADGRRVIHLEHPQQVRPEAEGVVTGDYVDIDGEPQIHLRIEPEIAGGTGTVALIVNMIPRVVCAPPGLVTADQMPLPAFAGPRMPGPGLAPGPEPAPEPGGCSADTQDRRPVPHGRRRHPDLPR